MFWALSATLQCLRNGRPAQNPQPEQPDHCAAHLDTHLVLHRRQASHRFASHSLTRRTRQNCAVAQRWERAEKGQPAGLPQNVGFSYPGELGKPMEVGSRTEGESCDGLTPESRQDAWTGKARRGDAMTDTHAAGPRTRPRQGRLGHGSHPPQPPRSRFRGDGFRSGSRDGPRDPARGSLGYELECPP
jgi:hypothetical protein